MPPAGQPARPAAALRAIRGGVENLLSVREVAARLSVCTATVYALAERGELPHVRISNAIRVAPEDLAAFVASQRKGGR
jgi:excisionase family DNA binding protein